MGKVLSNLVLFVSVVALCGGIGWGIGLLALKIGSR